MIVRPLVKRHKRKLQPGMVQALLVVLILGCIAACGGSPSPRITLPVHTTVTAHTSNVYSHFRGVYQFKGEDAPQNASNPLLAGANITFYWSQLELEQGTYQWNVLDQAIQPWQAHGKRVILRISTSGWAHWHPPYSGHGTPDWVYAQGVPSVKEIDGAIYPQYWHPLFLQALQGFVQAFAQRYDGNATIAYIQIGVGVGGETKVDTHGNANPQLVQLWQGIGYTNQVWWDAVQKIISIYSTSFTKTPLAIMPDATFIQKGKGYTEYTVLNYAVQHGIWLQDNGLFANRTLPPIWMKTTRAEEQVAATKVTGGTLLSELKTALDLGASYILVFTSDINDPANQAALQWAQSQVSSA